MCCVKFYASALCAMRTFRTLRAFGWKPSFIHDYTGKRNVTVWRPSVCRSVCPSRRNTHRDSPGDSMRRGQHTLWPDDMEARHACFVRTPMSETSHRWSAQLDVCRELVLLYNVDLVSGVPFPFFSGGRGGGKSPPGDRHFGTRPVISSCPLMRTMDGHIVRHGTVRSCQSAAAGKFADHNIMSDSYS